MSRTVKQSSSVDNLSKQDIRVPWYSKNHPMIPRFYVQPWTQDIKNRPILIHNAKNGGVPTYEHDDCLFLNKREQMTYNVQNRSQVDIRTNLPPRYEMLKPKNYQTTQRYNSNMLARF
ncbi:unnamed protein product [Brachionus calyciflorus]|uniref:Uncharacterized protein n=1 Tax=Brachionus calyciflorus TaxID=104777 RepID=A0A814RDB8_9BILA|nr:unnamed protein product [Brachionus calyciflorus]